MLTRNLIILISSLLITSYAVGQTLPIPAGSGFGNSTARISVGSSQTNTLSIGTGSGLTPGATVTFTFTGAAASNFQIFDPTNSTFNSSITSGITVNGAGTGLEYFSFTTFTFVPVTSIDIRYTATGNGVDISGLDLATLNINTGTNFTSNLGGFWEEPTITASSGTGFYVNNGTWVGGVIPSDLNNVIIPSGASVSVGSAESARNITVQSGGVLSIISGGSLAITDSLIIEPGGSYCNLRGSGAITVGSGYRFSYTLDHSGGRGYYVSAPRSNLTAAVWADADPSNEVYRRRESTASWLTLNSATNLEPNGLTGYVVYNPSAGALTYDFDGGTNTSTIWSNSSSITRSLAYTGSTASSGFHLIANPYACVADWGLNSDIDEWTKTNIDSTIWIRTNGQFSTYNSFDGSATNGGTRDIPAYQSFWVRSKPGGGSLTVNLDVQKAQTSTILRQAPELNVLSIKSYQDTLPMSDQIKVSFNPNALPIEDAYDSEKYLGASADYGELFSLSADNKDMAINNYGILDTGVTTIDMGFLSRRISNYKLVFENLSNFDTSKLSLELVDLIDSTTLMITPAINEYTFNSAVVRRNDPEAMRFQLRFINNSSTPLSLDDVYGKLAHVKIFNSGKSVKVDQLRNQSEGDYMIADLKGRVVAKGDLDAIDRNSINASKLSDGIYFIKVILPDGVKSHQLYLND